MNSYDDATELVTKNSDYVDTTLTYDDGADSRQERAGLCRRGFMQVPCTRNSDP